MAFPGTPRTPMAFPGTPRTPMAFPGTPRTPMASPRDTPDQDGFPGEVLGPDGSGPPAARTPPRLAARGRPCFLPPSGTPGAECGNPAPLSDNLVTLVGLGGRAAQPALLPACRPMAGGMGNPRWVPRGFRGRGRDGIASRRITPADKR
jgi:hypothetical protein